MYGAEWTSHVKYSTGKTTKQFADKNTCTVSSEFDVRSSRILPPLQHAVAQKSTSRARDVRRMGEMRETPAPTSPSRLEIDMDSSPLFVLEKSTHPARWRLPCIPLKGRSSNTYLMRSRRVRSCGSTYLAGSARLGSRASPDSVLALFPHQIARRSPGVPTRMHHVYHRPDAARREERERLAEDKNIAARCGVHLARFALPRCHIFLHRHPNSPLSLNLAVLEMPAVVALMLEEVPDLAKGRVAFVAFCPRSPRHWASSALTQISTSSFALVHVSLNSPASLTKPPRRVPLLRQHWRTAVLCSSG